MGCSAVFFDLDGTLVDSAQDLTIALQNTFKVLGLKPHSELKIRQWVGNGVDKLLHRALTNDMQGEAEKEKFELARAIFHEAYINQIGLNSKIFKGVLITLKKLKKENIKLACITNKDRIYTEVLLAEKKLTKYFDVVICGDDVKKKKPHAMPLIVAAEKIQVNLDHCIMVGDSTSDVLAANAAKIPVVCVSYGYAQSVDLSALQIACYVDDLSKVDFENIHKKQQQVA